MPSECAEKIPNNSSKVVVLILPENPTRKFLRLTWPWQRSSTLKSRIPQALLHRKQASEEVCSCEFGQVKTDVNEA